LFVAIEFLFTNIPSVPVVTNTSSFSLEKTSTATIGLLQYFSESILIDQFSIVNHCGLFQGATLHFIIF
jgi:hypothetical protein